MVGKDRRKLSQKRISGKTKGRKTKQHKARPSLKACDPFSGRSYKEKDESEFNLDPDKEELEDYVDKEEDTVKSYDSYKDKPNYRRGIVFANELEDMKEKKKEEKKQKRLNALNQEVVGGKKMGETDAEYHRRLSREKRQIIVEEILRNRKPSERVKRYREGKEAKREDSKKRKKEAKEDYHKQINNVMSVGMKPQVERPPQLKDLIDRMEKNNKMFEREEQKIVKMNKMNRRVALERCKQNMDRFN